MSAFAECHATATTPECFGADSKGGEPLRSHGLFVELGLEMLHQMKPQRSRIGLTRQRLQFVRL